MKILVTPNPHLHHQAKELERYDKKTIQEVKEMVEILKKTTNPKGVGLAATQVGLDKRFFVLLKGKTPLVYINPTIKSYSQKKLSDVYPKEDDRWLEGCLSIPKIWGFVDRFWEIEVSYYQPKTGSATEDLREITETLTDAEAAYFQHELDHLDGVLFTDRIREQGGLIFRETNSGFTRIDL